MRASDAKYYIENRERVLAKAAHWRAENQDKVRLNRIKEREKKKANRQAARANLYEETTHKKPRTTEEKQRTARAKAIEYYHKNREKHLLKKAIATKEISDQYCAQLLKMPIEKVPIDLLQMKREQITFLRLARQLKKVANESINDIG